MHRRIIVLLILAGAVFAMPLAGQAAGDSSDIHPHSGIPETIPEIEPVVLKPGESLRLTASTSIIADVLKQVAGEYADVSVLVKPGWNPHNYEAAPGDLRTVEEAHIVFVNGLDLEENLLSDIAAAAAGYIVPVSDGIDIIYADGHEEDEHGHDEHEEEHEEEDDHDHGGVDPHVWMDPESVIIWTRNIADVLSAADPDNSAAYAKNSESYIDRLRETDARIREMLKAVSPQQRKLVLDHHAFTYFARAYGFEIVGAVIPGTTSNAEPSARDMAALVQVLREHQIPAVFVGETASGNLKRLTETLVQETGSINGREVQIIETVTGALTQAGERGESYIDLMLYNAEMILKGLGN